MYREKTTRTSIWTSGLALTVAALLVASSTTATPLDNRSAALDGADRLLEAQLESGAFPWQMGSPGEFQNVQGNTAIALLDAYTLSLDSAYLAAAEANRDWIADFMEDNPDAFISAPNVFFLAKYALLTLDLGDLDLAREALDRAVNDDRYDGTPRGLAEGIIETRKDQGHTNLGIWDAAFLVRAAHDVGNTSASAEFAEVLAEQTTEDAIVDAFNETANWYEIGLTGLLFGLSEADYLEYQDILSQAADRLNDARCEDGSFSTTFQGEESCGSVQGTAYGVLGLTHALTDFSATQDACDFLRDQQTDDGGFENVTTANVVSEAVQALSACVVPVHNGVTSYADAAVGLL